MDEYFFWVKYFFAPCGLTTLFFTPSISFCITNSPSIMDKHIDDTSIQKLTKIHASAPIKLTHVHIPN
jgi:hypothetical protein